MNILYIGESKVSTTSYQRYLALKRLGHTVYIQNPQEVCKKHLQNALLNKIHYRTSYRFLQNIIKKWLSQILITSKYDLIWVNGGELIGKECLFLLKNSGAPVILYNNDDPSGSRDGNRFGSLIKAIPYYDLCVVMREVNVLELKTLGCKNSIRVMMSYDEEAHKPYAQTENIPLRFRSEVAFIGTWMRYEKRDEFLLKLIECGVPVSVWGNRWQKSPYWKKLEPHYRGSELSGRDYVAAIQGAKICLGLLSKGNRDLHTQRSLEVPYAGGLLCAERTSEHQELYKEGVEAVFWSDAAECADICKKLLADDVLRERIRLAGMQKVRALGVGNEDVCKKILATLNSEQISLQSHNFS